MPRPDQAEGGITRRLCCLVPGLFRQLRMILSFLPSLEVSGLLFLCLEALSLGCLSQLSRRSPRWASG